MEDKDIIFHQYFLELIDSLCSLDDVNITGIYAALEKLCKLFNVSKGVTCFYDSVKHEKMDKGEKFVCYDSGEESVEKRKIRVVSPAGTVASCIIYQAVGADPICEEDIKKIDIIQRSILSLISRNRLAKIVEKLTFYDEDGYRNKRYFFRSCENHLEENGNLDNLVALSYNLKNFSIINQDLGRKNGDVIIRKFTEFMQSLVGEDGTVCRLGGDGFLMLFDKAYLNNVIAAFSGTPIIYDESDKKRVMISAWAGVYVIPDNTVEHFGSILDKIIQCLNIARNVGKEPIVYYDNSMTLTNDHQKHIKQLFPDALKNEEFLVYYQPKIDVVYGKLAGAEALCRWKHNGELIQPNDFIPVLESGSDICKLDFYMLDHVCRDIRRWLDEGKDVVRVSVNLSRKHMIDMDLVDNILSIIDKNNVPHKYIEIELTETTADVEFRDLKRVVNGLQMAGVYASVDDFGTGYSSLNLLTEVPWNVIKVDKAFIPLDEDNDKSIRSIMFKYVVAMAKELGLECIAEGVETHKQVEALRLNECNMAQGYYFDKPLPKNEFEERLTETDYEVA